MKPRTGPSRRRFLRGTAATAAALGFPTIIPSGLLGRDAPSNRVHVGAIGVGSRSNGVNIAGIARFSDARIIACADPFEDRRNGFAAKVNKIYQGDFCRPCRDFRDLLKRDDIDAVTVCTGDYWHVPVAIAAVRAGKDIYVEKPLGTSMSWAWKLRSEASGRDIIFQYGTQQRSARQFQQAVNLVRNGYIGAIKGIDAWCPHMDEQATSPQLKKPFGSTEPAPVPGGLDYDLWLGPAPQAPCTADRTHHFTVFHCYDYALGFIAGWGAHPLDIAQWGLDADHTGPVLYEGTGKLPPEGGLFNTTRYWDIRCTYADGVAMRFMDLKTAKPVVEEYHHVVHNHGTVFHGEEGWVGVDRSAMYSHGGNKLRKVEFSSSDKLVGEQGSHQRGFINSVKSRKPAVNPLESAIRSDTISHLADICVRSGQPVKWDPRTEKLLDGSPAQNAFLNRQPRKEWNFFL
jgi:predicted dehydrogenase